MGTLLQISALFATLDVQLNAAKLQHAQTVGHQQRLLDMAAEGCGVMQVSWSAGVTARMARPIFGGPTPTPSLARVSSDLTWLVTDSPVKRTNAFWIAISQAFLKPPEEETSLHTTNAQKADLSPASTSQVLLVCT